MKYFPLLFITILLTVASASGRFLNCQEEDMWFLKIEFDCGSLENTSDHNEAFTKIFDNKENIDNCSGFDRRSRFQYRFYFKNCHLKTVPQTFFEQVDITEQICLDNVGVEKLDTGNFPENLYLRSLSMSRNNLTELPNSMFSSQGDLRDLDFSYNQIIKIEPNAFNAKKLHKINLSHNFLEMLPDELFGSTPQLSYIDLSYNQLETFQPEMRESKYLETLNLSNNKITRLSCSIFPYSDIRYISATFDITKNQLKKIDLNCDKWCGKVILNVEDNLLESLAFPASLIVSRLDTVLAKGNKINKITAESDLTGLKLLNLTRNSVTSTSDLLSVFKYGKSLKTLDLSYNNISNLGVNSLVKLQSLESLYLNNINLSHIGFGALSHSQNLTLLDLSRNSLKNFNFDLFLPNTRKVQKLYLNDNEITSFVGSPNVLSNLTQLNILNNNLSCKYLSQFLREIGSASVRLQPDPTLEPDDDRTNLGGVICTNREDELREEKPSDRRILNTTPKDIVHNFSKNISDKKAKVLYERLQTEFDL